MKDYSIIKELYLRRKGTCEQPIMSDERKKALDVAILADKEFREKFSDNTEIMELYGKQFDAAANYLCECDEDAYCHGFRVGVLVGFDIMKVFEDKE